MESLCCGPNAKTTFKQRTNRRGVVVYHVSCDCCGGPGGSYTSSAKAWSDYEKWAKKMQGRPSLRVIKGGKT